MSDFLAKVAPHWEFAIIVAVALVNILNGITKHYTSQKSKTARVLTKITEVLSFVSSKDVAGIFKAPLKDKRPNP